MDQFQHTLLIQCEDQAGLIYQVTNVIFHQQLNILSNNEYVDQERNRFFFRCVLSGKVDAYLLTESLKKVLPKKAEVRLVPKTKKRIVVLVTKEHHCLGDILIKNQFNELGAEVLAVISNHETLKPLVSKFDLPYHFVPTKGLSRQVHEEKVKGIIDKYDPTLLVLAKYMRILTPNFVEQYPNRIINIHHSFLPAFIGANPYGQAHDRGVKIIGATAHYVNNELDQGPIITQNVINVDHDHTPKSLAAAGKEVEKTVLNRALKLVFEDRVLLNGNKTVVF